MRLRHLRLLKRRTYTAAAAASALVGAMSCVTTGNDSSPNPSPIQANVVAEGTLVLTNCGPITGSSNVSCSYSGPMTNNGPGCAAGISGTTVSTDSTGAQVGSSDWSTTGTLLPGVTGTYRGSGLAVPGNNAPSSYHTTIFFNSVLCPS